MINMADSLRRLLTLAAEGYEVRFSRAQRVTGVEVRVDVGDLHVAYLVDPRHDPSLMVDRVEREIQDMLIRNVTAVGLSPTDVCRCGHLLDRHGSGHPHEHSVPMGCSECPCTRPRWLAATTTQEQP